MAINEKWDRGWGAIMLKLWGSAKPGAKKDYSLNEINSIWKQKAKKMHWNGSSVSWSIVKHHPHVGPRVFQPNLETKSLRDVSMLMRLLLACGMSHMLAEPTGSGFIHKNTPANPSTPGAHSCEHTRHTRWEHDVPKKKIKKNPSSPPFLILFFAHFQEQDWAEFLNSSNCFLPKQLDPNMTSELSHMMLHHHVRPPAWMCFWKTKKKAFR